MSHDDFVVTEGMCGLLTDYNRFGRLNSLARDAKRRYGSELVRTRERQTLTCHAAVAVTILTAVWMSCLTIHLHAVIIAILLNSR
jgi:hypothetical protein